MPRCLGGLEVGGVERPSWAPEAWSADQVGVIRDSRTGMVTVALDVRGGPFTLLDRRHSTPAWPTGDASSRSVAAQAAETDEVLGLARPQHELPNA